MLINIHELAVILAFFCFFLQNSHAAHYFLNRSTETRPQTRTQREHVRVQTDIQPRSGSNRSLEGVMQALCIVVSPGAKHQLNITLTWFITAHTFDLIRFELVQGVQSRLSLPEMTCFVNMGII